MYYDKNVNYKKVNLISQWVALISIMRFLSSKICFSDTLYLQKLLSGWTDIDEIEWHINFEATK